MTSIRSGGLPALDKVEKVGEIVGVFGVHLNLEHVIDAHGLARGRVVNRPAVLVLAGIVSSHAVDTSMVPPSQEVA